MHKMKIDNSTISTKDFDTGFPTVPNQLANKIWALPFQGLNFTQINEQLNFINIKLQPQSKYAQAQEDSNIQMEPVL